MSNYFWPIDLPLFQCPFEIGIKNMLETVQSDVNELSKSNSQLLKERDNLKSGT